MQNGSRSLTRSRLVLLGATVVVVAGLLVGLGAFFLSPARAAVGPLPSEALVLPADAQFVMGFDVRRLTASPLYARYTAQKNMRIAPPVLTDLEQKTGLDPARDLDTIVVATSGAGREAKVLAVAIGRFDRGKLAKTLEAEGKARKYAHEGVTVYAFKSEGPQETAIAFLGDNALVLGAKGSVEAAVASRARGLAPLRSNGTILALVEKVRPGSTFWMVGDRTLLAGLPTSMAAPGSSPGGVRLDLPALRSLTVTGDLDPQVSLSITGETSDNASAAKLADVVRGLVALATLQASQKPELQQLASAVNVATETNRVLVTVRLPYALLDALQASSSARPAVPAPKVAPGP